jgi:hypothetical protein
MTTAKTHPVCVNPVCSKTLLGRCVAVKALSGRSRWWMKVIAVSDCGRFLKVQSHGQGKAAGATRWVASHSVSTRR